MHSHFSGATYTLIFDSSIVCNKVAPNLCNLFNILLAFSAIAFTSVMLLIGHQEEHPAYKRI